MNSITAALTSGLVHSLWLGAIVALVLAFLLPRLKEHTPNARYTLLLAGMGVLSLTPFLTAWLLYEPVPAATVGATGSVGMSSMDISIGPIGTLTFASDARIAEWVLPLWLLGVGALSLRLIWSCARVGLLGRRGAEAPQPVLDRARDLAERMGLRHRFRVVEVSDPRPETIGPGVIGWLRPIVVLPSSTLLGLSPVQLEAILAHELAHIRRYDYLVNLAQMVAETLLFFNPAVWWVSARIREERELCCDDLAVSVSGNAVVYARALTRLERVRLHPSPALPSAGRTLPERVLRILGHPLPSRPLPAAPALVALAIAATVGLLTTSGLEASSQDPAPTDVPTVRDVLILQAQTPAVVPSATALPAATPAPEPEPPVAEATPPRQAPDAWAVYVTRNQGRLSFVSGGPDVPGDTELGGDDILWFHRSGEAWIVRDADIVNRVALIATNDRGAPAPGAEMQASREQEFRRRALTAEAGLAELQRQMQEQRARLEQAQTAESAQVQDELREQEREMARRVRDLDAIREQMQQMQARRDSLRALDQAGAAEIEQIFDDAIASGLAVPAP